jgi:hypothetical protein
MAIEPHLELNGASRPGLVVNPYLGGESFPAAIQTDPEFGNRVRAEAVLKGDPSDLHRVVVDGAAGVRRAPPLHDLLYVEGLKGDSSGLDEENGGD